MIKNDRELVPVRIEDWLSLGRLVNKAASRGYSTLFALFNRLRERGVMLDTAERSLALWIEWSDAQKFKEIMDDHTPIAENDVGFNIIIGDLSVCIERGELDHDRTAEHAGRGCCAV